MTIQKGAKQEADASHALQPVTCRPVDAKKIFGVSRATIYNWAAAGHITIYKRAGMSFLRVQEVEAYICGLGTPSSD